MVGEKAKTYHSIKKEKIITSASNCRYKVKDPTGLEKEAKGCLAVTIIKD